MGRRYAILGGGGSFGIHSALYLLDHADPELVMGIGRNLMRPEPFSLNVEKRPRYEYHAYHVTYELDLLLELLDRKKPQVIVNFAAQGEGAAVGRIDEAGLAGAFHPDRHVGNVRLGRARHDGRRTDQAV